MKQSVVRICGFDGFWTVLPEAGTGSAAPEQANAAPITSKMQQEEQA